ncbi:MAG: ATP-binding cassette domain-containing protein, partial [Thiohalorhabdaceae bacterium]
MTDQQPLIHVAGLERSFGPTRAIADIAFDLNPGDILGFLGPNGAGKSTTMRILTGNLAPTRGTVTIHGFDILGEPQRAKARIGYLPETPPVYTELTVDEYLRYAARLNGVSRANVAEAMRVAKTRCGIADVGARL